jgi:lipid-binding SYLF domain-containing protein
MRIFLLLAKMLHSNATSLGGKMLRLLTVILGSLGIFLGGCAATGDTPTDKRITVQKMRQEVLTELYRVRPSARGFVQGAPGYAVFSNANVNLIFASFGGGYGVVRDAKTGKDTYMKMGEVGIGLGLGVKDFRAVFVFDNAAVMKRFVETGWEFGGHADAAAKARDKGGAVGGEVLADGITVFQLTESGLALQATVKGTKYWKDDELN